MANKYLWTKYVYVPLSLFQLPSTHSSVYAYHLVYTVYRLWSHLSDKPQRCYFPIADTQTIYILCKNYFQRKFHPSSSGFSYSYQTKSQVYNPCGHVYILKRNYLNYRWVHFEGLLPGKISDPTLCATSLVPTSQMCICPHGVTV